MTGTHNQQALDKINKLEAGKAPAAEAMEVEYDMPTFTTHLNNVDVKEKGTAVLQCKVEPLNDPTMKIGLSSPMKYQTF